MRGKLKRVQLNIVAALRRGLLFVDVKLPILGRMARKVPRWGWLSIFVVVVFISYLLIFVSRAHALSQGPLSPGTASDSVVTGGSVWSTPANALASDSVYTSNAIAGGGVSDNLTVTNFGFTIPTGSTINGIQADVEKYSPTSTKGTVVDNNVQTIKGGVIGGTSLASTATWPASNTYVTYGNSSNLWGQTWAATDINASNFGIAIAAKNVKAGGGATLTAYIDYVRVTVFYTPPPVNYAQASYRFYGNQDSTGTVTFAKAYGGTAIDYGQSVAKTSDNGYAVAGYTTSFGGGGDDVFLDKFDGGGDLVWRQTWGGLQNDVAMSVIQTSDGGYAVAGYTASAGAGGNDAFVAKFDASGNLTWNTFWGGTGNDQANSIVQTSDGGYAIAGTTYSYGDTTNGDAFLAKFTSAGVLSWSTTWGGANADTGMSIVQASDGGYAMAGTTSNFGARGQDAYLAKFTAAGALTWTTLWGGAGNDSAAGIVQTSDGGYAIAGTTYSYGDTTNGDAFLAKFTSAGVLSWSTTWGGTSSDSASGILQTSDGGYVVGGDTGSFGAGSQDAFLAKFDSTGALSWSKTWGGANADYVQGPTQTFDGGYAMAGSTASYGVGQQNSFLIKFDSTGSITNCGSNCTAPIATTTSPAASSSSPAATTTSPAATNSNASQGVGYATPTTTVMVATTPSIDVGAPSAAQNTAITAPSDGQPFRMRMDIGISSYQLAASGGAFQLQYAPMTTSCDTSFTNTPSSAYQNVTDTSTIRFYDNPNAVTGLPAATDTNDPTDGTNALVRETYQEKGTTTFTNPAAIPVGSDGVWDFALTMSQSLQNTSYCLRVVLSGGTLLTSYAVIPEITTPASSYTQGNYRLFTPAPSAVTFANAWGTTNTDNSNGIVQTSDGGYAEVGSTIIAKRVCTVTCSVSNYSQAFLAKYDLNDKLVWSSAWSGSNNDYGVSVVQTSDGGYAITGYTASYGAGGQDAFLAKFTSAGALSWSTLWGGTGNDQANSVIQTSDSGFAIAGLTTSFGAGGNDAFLAKFTSAGALSWSTLWGGTGNDQANSVIQTSDSGFAIAGATYSYGDTTNGDAFLAKFTSAGALSWSTNWGGTGSDSAAGIVQTSDGGYAIGGNTASYGAGGQDAFLAKFTSAGALSWSKTWGGTGSDSAAGIVQTSDGGYAIGGNTASYGAGGQDAFLAKFTSAGALSWSTTIGGTGSDSAAGIVQTSDGGYAIGGQTYSYGDTTNGDTLLAKFDLNGRIANCGTICTSPAVTVGSPAATSASQSATSSSGTATTSSVSPTSTGEAGTSTVIVAAPGATVGSPLGAQSKPYDPSRTGVQFRLRTVVDVSGSGTDTSGQSFKLQYALKGSDGACDTAFNGESYADVTTTTPIYYFDGTGVSGEVVTTSANDPADTNFTTVPETYQESNNFTNSISPVYAAQTSLWDFSLGVKAGTLIGHDYCLRIVKSDGTLLNSYSNIVDIGYGPSMSALLRQGMWWNRVGVRQGFFTPANKQP